MKFILPENINESAKVLRTDGNGHVYWSNELHENNCERCRDRFWKNGFRFFEDNI